MPRIVSAIRHLAYEDLGLFAPLLEARGYQIRYIDAGIDDLGGADVLDADLLVVLGGPIGVGDIDQFPFVTDEIKAIDTRINRGQPVLGMCLGAQLIAAALGAPVTATDRTEIGFSPIALTPEGENSVLEPLNHVPVLHWHSDEFAIPDGAVRLATKASFPNQAFSYGATALGLQFHLEADPARFEPWLIAHVQELAANGIDPRELREEARKLAPTLVESASAVLNPWLDMLK